jgi:hypothetical protein
METNTDKCGPSLCKQAILKYGNPSVVCSLDESPSFCNRFISPHPLTPYMYANPIPKALFFFIALLVPLIVYSSMDVLMPVNGSYGNIEYSGHAYVLQDVIDRMGPQQFVVFGFSCALHLCNAVSYATFLMLACVWCRWKLALLGHRILAVFFDVYAWLQVLECSLYFIQHISLKFSICMFCYFSSYRCIISTLDCACMDIYHDKADYNYEKNETSRHLHSQAW